MNYRVYLKMNQRNAKQYSITQFTLIIFLTGFFIGCQGQQNEVNPAKEVEKTASIGITGSPLDVSVSTSSGIVLMGGSTDVDEAIAWMIDRAKGGDFLILRASGSTGYNNYIFDMGNVNSVETLLINTKEKANYESVGKRIREAEMVFIAGGDQGDYVKFWKDTEVSKALAYLVNEKKIPIGGTSAGCAVLSDFIFDAKNGSVISEEALTNPYDTRVSISKSFIQIPVLKNILADQHYSQRERKGRHIAFLARIKKDEGVDAKGIGVDEKTAVCIDADGNAIVFGTNNAYFISPMSTPETCDANVPLHWYHHKEALKFFKISGSKSGTPAFNLNTWVVTTTTYWYVEQGVFKEKN